MNREPSVRGFGVTMGLAGSYLAWRLARVGASAPAAALFFLGAALAMLSVIAPARARPLARAWMRLGEAIGRFTTPVLLTVVFALVVTPTRLALVLARRDPLRRRRDPAAGSHWEERREPGFTPAGFERPW